ncbi:MAG TPA: hypothetical protein VFH17_06245 [Coriobacteriia bacterium]|nr:hypothetical protein [Coriobacteriia bacterium]
MKRAGYVAAGLLALLVLAGYLALTFGTPQAPYSPAATPPPADVPVGRLAAHGEVPPPDPESPFAFQIPGCRCHSDDPAVVREHASYRLNQCSGCHAGGP